MSDVDVDWDDDSFEPKGFENDPSVVWGDEDKTEAIANINEDDNEEKKSTEPAAAAAASSSGDVKAYQKKKKKHLTEWIAEKEKARLAAEQAPVIKEEEKELTREEKGVIKLKQRKLQEESDLQLMKEAFGVSSKKGLIDGMEPSTEEEFMKFSNALIEKITPYQGTSHYAVFLEKLFTELVVSLDADDCKKISSTITNITHEKLRQMKEQGKKKKKKTKIALRMERDDISDVAGGGEFDDFEEL